MTSARGRATAFLAPALLASLAIAGCGFGPGEETGEAELLITRDYGRVVMQDRSVPLRESDDAMRLLTRVADRVETRYGGGFVESIDGYGSTSDGTSRTDWFFFVDGLESPVGALEARVEPGQSVWWDRRDWSEAMHVPAVVGSWPKPFGSDSPIVHVRCSMARERACDGVIEDLRATGSRVVVGGSPSASLRVLIGPWEKVRQDLTASTIERGPEESGVYARFVYDSGDWALRSLEASGQVVDEQRSTGIVAALSPDAHRVTWVVSGTDEASVPRHLDPAQLIERYAVVFPGGRPGDGREVPLR